MIPCQARRTFHPSRKCLNLQKQGLSSVGGYALCTKQVYEWEGKDISVVDLSLASEHKIPTS